MSGFQHLSVDGFRRLCGVECELGDLSVLIGANGSGKTSVLDVFSLLAASAQGNLGEKLGELSGLAGVLPPGRAKRLSFGVSLEVPAHEPLQYRLSLSPQGIGYAIDSESLTQVRPPHREPFKHIDSNGRLIRYFNINTGRLEPPQWEQYRRKPLWRKCPRCSPSPNSSGNGLHRQRTITCST
jgi:predicted ATPase